MKGEGERRLITGSRAKRSVSGLFVRKKRRTEDPLSTRTPLVEAGKKQTEDYEKEEMGGSGEGEGVAETRRRGTVKGGVWKS